MRISKKVGDQFFKNNTLSYIQDLSYKVKCGDIQTDHSEN